MAFDDRELDIARRRQLRVPLRGRSRAAEGTMIVREVYNDWDAEERGTLTIERPDTLGRPRRALDPRALAKKYDVAAQMLIGWIQTWFAFPECFPTRSRSTP